jgi:hypothetical protein
MKRGTLGERLVKESWRIALRWLSGPRFGMRRGLAEETRPVTQLAGPEAETFDEKRIAVPSNPQPVEYEPGSPRRGPLGAQTARDELADTLRPAHLPDRPSPSTAAGKRNVEKDEHETTAD